MAETTQNDLAQQAAGMAAAARDRGMEQLEGAKGQLAEGAERMASAVERTADELGGDGDNALSGFGHSVASLMRQLAGGLRERDVDEFARELAGLARRNPGVFLAGSVALGFGIARFFKARAAHSETRDYGNRGWEDSSRWQGAKASNRGTEGWNSGQRGDFDADETLDLSASRGDAGRDSGSGGAQQSDIAAEESNPVQQAETASDDTSALQATPQDDDRNQAKARASTKQTKRGGKS